MCVYPFQRACPNLRMLILDPPTFADQQRMLLLDYSDFQHLSRLSKLVQLNIAALKSCDGRFLSVVSLIPTLESLNITLCPLITDGDLVWLCPSYLPHLRELYISRCSITAKGLQTLLQMIQLTDLDLSGIHDTSYDYVQELFDKLPRLKNVFVCQHLKNYRQFLTNPRPGRNIIINHRWCK